MGLWDKIRGEFIDIIEWTDSSNDTMVWRFPRYENEIKMGAKLTVRESQVAVFINEGQIADVFQPGMYTLQTQNMPILSTLKGWKYGFNSPFKAEVYFVNTKQFTDQGWGTKNPITLEDERFGMFEVRAYGKYALRVTDASKFIKEIVGTDGHFTTEEIGGQLRSMIVSQFSDAIGESRLGAEKFAQNFDELSKVGFDKLGSGFEEYGLKITRFLVENISMPEEIKKEIFEYSRLGKVNTAELAKLKAAKSIEIAAANEGIAGAGMGMGVGFGMGNQMANMFGQMNPINPQQQQQVQNPQYQSTMTPPPPPPVLQLFIAVNGQQTGPFTEPALMQMIQQGSLKRETMVWKAGMPGWAQAGTLPELSHLFGAVPPPVPPPIM